jgi:hypothetical protein
LFKPLPSGAGPAHDFSMLGRIGKRYPRMQPPLQPRGAPARRMRRFGALGGLIALLSALGAVGWLFFR